MASLTTSGAAERKERRDKAAHDKERGKKTSAASTSLLDVVTDEYNKDRARRTTRLFFVATYNPAHSEADVETWCRGFVAARQPSYAPGKLKTQENALTGLFMSLSGTALAAVLEAPTNVIRELIRLLAEMELDPKGLLVRPKVCTLTEEVPREFPAFGFRSFKAAQDDFQAPANMVKPVSEMYIKAFLEAGRSTSASSLTEEKAVETLERSQQRNLHIMPTVEKIVAFQACEDICTPTEWMAIFETPMNLVLESDVEWPVEPWLKY